MSPTPEAGRRAAHTLIDVVSHGDDNPDIDGHTAAAPAGSPHRSAPDRPEAAQQLDQNNGRYFATADRAKRSELLTTSHIGDSSSSRASVCCWASSLTAAQASETIVT